MIQFHHVYKRFEAFQLKDITFHLPPGYIMGLVGPNGSGKTTIIKMLLGLYQPTEGEIYVHNKTLLENEKEIKNSIGYVLAEHYYPVNNTLEENATKYGHWYSSYEKEEFHHYCQEFGLEVTKKLGECSKGEGMKFQLAFALSTKPKLLLMDEPTANFDPEFRERMIQKMVDFVANGEHSILFSTHITDELDQIADYITFINHGRMVFSLDKETMYQTYQLVTGSREEVLALGKEQIVYMESSQYNTKALIHSTGRKEYPVGMLVENPTVEDIMYYVVKGERERDKNRYW